METIAVYWEPIIRTYGFQFREGLVWHALRLPLDRVDDWSRGLQGLADPAATFQLTWARLDPEASMTMSLVCEPVHWNRIRPIWIGNTACDGGGAAPETMVDLVWFHGPHFGDRYGIMDFTYQVLHRGQVPLLAAICSVASIYLVLPAGQGAATRMLLAGAFEIPTAVNGPRQGASPVQG
ncbi:hypothetical protein [Desulfatitalea alkaliphila]|uniref:Uncharacterized protein n=1 Tax=Desulfatitalea alkaliphila TaxID=2929485 RepID=A0AA41R4R8_9BACT|nr:hypothetical protein [Desulfatitalea alkaliphila]MCJ8500786.1 hypothetical protein [Desulfatitalea alkaliphila]